MGFLFDFFFFKRRFSAGEVLSVMRPCLPLFLRQCKLSMVARDTLLTDIDLDTVDMMTNFDGNENEPVVLPSRLPVSRISGVAGALLLVVVVVV